MEERFFYMTMILYHEFIENENKNILLDRLYEAFLDVYEAFKEFDSTNTHIDLISSVYTFLEGNKRYIKNRIKECEE